MTDISQSARDSVAGVMGSNGRYFSEMGRASISHVYEGCLLVYLVSLLFIYPYGVALTAEANLRLPDFMAAVCLIVGFAALSLKAKIRYDIPFLIAAGPFILLEFLAPVIGAVGYQNWMAGVSGIRMAMLWLPVIFLTLLASPLRMTVLERNLATILKLSLWANVVYATIQMMVAFGYAPRTFLFTDVLRPWAVDEQFIIVQGLRPAGFFVKTTALSVFGVICLSFFYARYVSRLKRIDLAYSMLAFFVIVLTTSRVAAFAAVLILLAGWTALAPSRKASLGIIVAAGVAGILILIERTVGIQEVFFRFQRLLESGILEDVSFGARFYTIWPSVLEVAREYTFGTLVTAPRAIELVDSGYLSYYAQGKWLFLAALSLLLLCMWYWGIRGLIKTRGVAELLLLNLTIYFTMAMVVTNPLRAPLAIFFIVFGFWMLKCERGVRLWPCSLSDVKGHEMQIHN